jgi:hypothetical protein
MRAEISAESVDGARAAARAGAARVEACAGLPDGRHSYRRTGQWVRVRVVAIPARPGLFIVPFSQPGLLCHRQPICPARSRQHTPRTTVR